MKIQNIKTDQIDQTDQTFGYTFNRDGEQLEASIRKMGVLQPVKLQPISETSLYRIITGFQRVQTANKLKIKEIPAIVFDEQGPKTLDFFTQSIHENSLTRIFNPVEIALALSKLVQQFQVPENDIVENYFPLLGLGKNNRLLSRYLQILELDESIKIALAADLLGIEMAQRLTELSEADRKLIFSVFESLKLGKNRQREILNFFRDIANLKEVSYVQIGHQINLDKILNDESLQTPLKTEAIRTALYRLRYPRLSEVETKYQEIIKRLKVPASVKIVPFPFFEETRFSIQFNFRNQAELQKRVKALSRMADDPAVDELTKLT